MKAPRRPGNRATRDGNFGFIDPKMTRPSDKHARPEWMARPELLPRRPPSAASSTRSS